jgi:hypothetical protein
VNAVIRRPFFVALAASAVSLCANVGQAAAASVECTPKPANPVGYDISSVHADQVTIPESAPAIAVLDTGIANVPELQGRIKVGYNVAGDNENTFDIDGHGTAVATIAAGAAGGVRGVSPSSPVIPIKIFDDTGASSPDDFVAAIERAVNAKAGVINVSAAGTPTGIDAATKRSIQDAINAAVSLDIPVLAASGNEGDSALDIPAAFAHVIAVGATDEEGSAAPFSNSGTGLDLVAPGSNLVTAAPSVLCSSGYTKATGTSFAVPLASGATALLLAKEPDLDVGQVTDMLRLRGARSAAPLWTDAFGFGMLDVPAVLNAPIPTKDVPEVNDDIHWAKLQPIALSASKKKKTLFARMAPHTDPADVYGVRLKKGQSFHARVTNPSGVKISLSFGQKTLKAKKGTSFSQKITKTGTYYVGLKLKSSPASGTGYALYLSR